MENRNIVSLEDSENSGEIIVLNETDFFSGMINGIEYVERVADGDWEKYKPVDEWQRRRVNGNLGYDTFGCVSFSALNIVEMQVYYLIKTGQVSQEKIDLLDSLGYLDGNFYPNFNDWYTVVMSGTTEKGNSKQAVWDSIRKHGLLPQKAGYQVNDFTTREAYQNTKPTAKQIEQAKKILDIIDIAYEWISYTDTNFDNVAYHLKHAPLHISSPTCKSWNTRPPTLVTDCGSKVTNHATTYIGQSKGQFHKVLDHYDPFVKNLSWDYYIPYVIKGVVTVKGIVIGQPFLKDLKKGDRSNEVKRLQKFLIKLGYNTLETGLYGDMTFQAVKDFQEDHAEEILKPLGLSKGSGFFGKSTRAFINSTMI